MKKAIIVYWTTTILFAAFMIFSAIPDVLQSAEAVQFMNHLGYPPYFTPFIGVAKIIGSIAILIPTFNRIKEWAYAGLFFDLIGAVYSLVATDGWMPQLSFMVLPFLVGIISYKLHLQKSTVK